MAPQAILDLAANDAVPLGGHVVVQIAASAGTLSFCFYFDFSIAPDDCPVVYTSGITQRAGDATSFGFIGISETLRSLP